MKYSSYQFLLNQLLYEFTRSEHKEKCVLHHSVLSRKARTLLVLVTNTSQWITVARNAVKLQGVYKSSSRQEKFVGKFQEIFFDIYYWNLSQLTADEYLWYGL